MKVAIFSAHAFEMETLLAANQQKHELVMIDARLTETSAPLAKGCDAASLFVQDHADAEALSVLNQGGCQYIALRSAGFNHVDLAMAKTLGIRVARVPAYSPYAIAEHTVALMLALNRKLVRAHHRIMDANFSLDGLVGFDMHGKTVGIIGTGKIGQVLAGILHGFGCKLIASDKFENESLKLHYQVQYVDNDTLFSQSDVITLHVPLSEDTRYLIDRPSIAKMKPGVMLINTSRGGLVNTKAVIDALKTKHIGSFGIDVYEEEDGLFFEDHSEEVLMDDTIARLMTFKNVLITSHQAFLTDTALRNIADTTVYNLDCFAAGKPCENEIIL
ncbi:MAG: 2-hydroxyacid dehydrogenase [Cyclobacteriaceae bacterium]